MRDTCSSGSIQPELPFRNPVLPEALHAQSQLRFRCHPGIACFNACCRQADVTLTPYDILRLKRRLGMSSTEFLRRYTVPFQMDGDGLPGVKLRTDEDGACLQLAGEQGCGVYPDRPTVCRYYPVALLAVRETDAPAAEERYSLVREDHCLGHDAERTLTIAEYRAEQCCEEYDARNRDWYQLVLKKKSAGPGVGRPPQTSLNLFFMASYDLDTFRRFIQSTGFHGTYPLSDDVQATLAADDDALLEFAGRFLRQVLFGEHSIPEAADAWERRVAQRQAVWEARRQVETARRQHDEDKKYTSDLI